MRPGKIQKNQTLLATRKLCTARRRVRNDLVLTIAPESQRKLVLRNIVTFARSMGARSRCTILEIAVGLRKMKRENPISAPLRKAERNPIPSFAQLSKKLDKFEKVIKKNDTKKRKRCSSDSDSNSE